MKIQNKKMIAFLMAIVMIVTFVNFGTLSAFANDDEPIENTEITLEDNTEGNSEEQPVEELVSEIPELVSEPSSPDDPTENGSLGDISSGEVDFSQGDNPVDVNGLGQPGTYEPIGSGDAYIPDGVYSLKNVGNANFWASILNSNSDAGAYAIQTQSSANPIDSFNRAYLFKISRIPNTDRYVIRSMLNNRLGLYFDGSNVKTKVIPSVDSSVSYSDTFQIVYNDGGYVIKQAGTSSGISAPNSTASGNSSAKLQKGTLVTVGMRGRWQLYRYTGESKVGVPLDFSPNDWSYGATLNTEYTVELKPWSTTIGANTPYILLHPESEGAATVQRINDFTIKITPTKVGPIVIRAIIRLDGTTTSHVIYRCNFITIPDFDGENAVIKNIGSGKYMDIEGPSSNSGAIIQQWTFHGAAQSRWTLELTSWGYFYVKSLYSNLYLGVDSSNTLLVKQYSTQNDYTKWIFTETSSGNYALKCKAVDNKVLAVPSSNSGNGTDLTMVAYTDSTNYYAEWNIETLHIKINLYVDEAYRDRVTSYATDLPNSMLAIQQRYLEEFDIFIEYSTIIPFTSLGDECDALSGGNYDSPCSHGDICINSDYSATGEGNQTIHHKNYYNLLHRIPFPDTNENTMLIFIGHKLCLINNQGEHDDYTGLGMKWPGGLATITNYDNTLVERKTMMHEIGHFYGAHDHYNEGDTEKLNEGLENPIFNDDCIYGKNAVEENVMNDLLICEGCRQRIIANLNRYSH